MANHERGEYALTVGDRTYVLVLDLNALCELEDFLSTPDKRVTTGEAFAAALRLSMTHIRALGWCAFQRHQPQMTVSEAGDVIQRYGGYEKFLELLVQVKKLSEPEGGARPQQARQPRRTGARTTSTPDASGSRPMTSGG